MLIFEAVDVDLHIRESELASLALREFRKRYRSDPTRRAYTMRDINPAFERLAIRLVRPAADVAEKSEGWVDGDMFSAFVTIHIRVSKDEYAHVMGDRFETIFRHEFQHYLDLCQDRKFAQHVDADKDMTGYVNSDTEYPAWFKQQAEPLLRILRAAKEGRPLGKIPKIEPNFRTYMEDGQHFHSVIAHGVPYNKFSAETRRRYLRDLAAVHKAAVAIEGATGPFRLKLVGRIVYWLARHTSIGNLL